MLHHRKAPSTSLEEDFKALGLGVDQDSIHSQATQTIEEAVVGIGVHGHGEGLTEGDDDKSGGGDGGGDITESADDPIDGKLVTRELLSRIVNLPLENMEADDFDAILNELKQKELPEGDEELAGLAEAVVEQLVEAKVQRIRKAKGGFVKKAKAGFQKVGGAIKRIAVGKRIKKARERKKYMRSGGRIKAAKWRRTVGKRHEKRLKSRKAVASDLAIDLSTLVSESIVGDKYAPVMERLASIFDLLDEQICDAEVCAVLESTWENLTSQITEDTNEEDFMEAIKPSLVVIKRCLEEFETVDQAEDQAAASEGDDGDGKGEDGGEEGND